MGAVSNAVGTIHTGHAELLGICEVRRRAGESWRAIADDAGVSRRTLRRYLRRAKRMGI